MGFLAYTNIYKKALKKRKEKLTEINMEKCSREGANYEEKNPPLDTL